MTKRRERTGDLARTGDLESTAVLERRDERTGDLGRRTRALERRRKRTGVLERRAELLRSERQGGHTGGLIAQNKRTWNLMNVKRLHASKFEPSDDMT